MRNNKLLKELAPFLTAVLLVLLLIFLPFNVTPSYSKHELNEFAADPGNRLNFIGYAAKAQALNNSNYLPILGSSELEHVNPYHPTSFFKKYPSGYTPYLVGMPGTSPLTHFFYVNSVANELKNRKIVFIISPQWFTQNGLNESAFDQFISKGEIYSWLASANANDLSTQILAKRLLNFKGASDDLLISDSLMALEKGKSINPALKALVVLSEESWKKEDDLFSGVSSARSKRKNNLASAMQHSKSLPLHQKDILLSQDAIRYAMRTQNDNPFMINNSVWQENLRHRWINMRGYQKCVSYLKSPEYADFQALLELFAKNHDDVKFIIQPVNQMWYQYTGLSISMLQEFSDKISTQLESQGFTTISDFTDKYNTPYFIGDTDHFGSLGWLDASLSIQKFMKSTPKTINYEINNKKFMSQEWENQTSNFN
ncbi:MAG TPA: D-alanyl-lipoteichoic acid biosynthesis protein DltD [Lactovum miscens]|uniref:D-alanyl-lipoteichoic acid biosynthesis protein DltD n=1 Tax=Lactovum miscens TaxID=190387 RepID=UPI002ED78DC6